LSPYNIKTLDAAIQLVDGENEEMQEIQQDLQE